MGYKNICFRCRRTFNVGTDLTNIKYTNCPECNGKMTFISQRFRPPRRTEDKKWETISYLIENGFIYQHIYEKVIVKNDRVRCFEKLVKYPENIREAKEFVEKYKDQAIKIEK
jgi:hypothetical protein